METAFFVIAALSGAALILSVMLQTTKAESFSAAMGGSSGADRRFKPGSKEEWLYKITKYSAIVWLVAMVIGSFLHYRAQ
ncbi:MAG: preprotein translocase subunit SecG [Armatimonadetes bacterium]|nr:preprotein translocase subunit SecG [Armatimonadota bacterium]